MIAEESTQSKKKQLARRFFKPISIFLLLGLLISLMFFKDYGASWDEPEFYQYADLMVKAYSISDRLDGTYNLNSLLSFNDLQLYGPGYLLMGKVFQFLFRWLFSNTTAIEFWHLTNYLLFLLGSFFLYKIMRMFSGQKASLIGTIFFHFQPVLFGSAWINPKDIPLLVFFLGSIYYGILSVNSISLIHTYEFSPIPGNKMEDVSYHHKRKIVLISLLAMALSIMAFAFGSTIDIFLKNHISWLYHDAKGTIMNHILMYIAKNISASNLSLYAYKAIEIFHRMRNAGLLLAIFSALWSIETIWFPNAIRKFWRNARLLLIRYREIFFNKPVNHRFLLFLAASIFLGITISIRVVGPLAGFLIALLAFLKYGWKSLPYIFFYGACSLLIAYASWPFLWVNTKQNFLYVYQHMSANPVQVNVLFNGIVHGSDNLPLGYLPILMMITLTEMTFPLMFAGIFIQIYEFFKKTSVFVKEFIILTLWFLIPFLYVLILRPAMYDNYRHFLFLLPPIYVFSSFAIEKILKWISSIPLQALVVFVLMLPGIFSIIQLHPYEYSFYNSFIGGVKGAEDRYEIDYWLLCYKDLMNIVNQSEDDVKNVYVAFNPDIVKLYAKDKINVSKIDNINYSINSVIFLPKRWDYQLLYPEYEVKYEIRRSDVPFCVGKVVGN